MLSSPRTEATIVDRRRFATASTGEVMTGCTVAIHSLSQETSNPDVAVADAGHDAEADADQHQYGKCIEQPVSPPTEGEPDDQQQRGHQAKAEQLGQGQAPRVIVHPDGSAGLWLRWYGFSHRATPLGSRARHAHRQLVGSLAPLPGQPGPVFARRWGEPITAKTRVLTPAPERA